VRVTGVQAGEQAAPAAGKRQSEDEEDNGQGHGDSFLCSNFCLDKAPAPELPARLVANLCQSLSPSPPHYMEACRAIAACQFLKKACGRVTLRHFHPCVAVPGGGLYLAHNGRLDTLAQCHRVECIELPTRDP